MKLRKKCVHGPPWIPEETCVFSFFLFETGNVLDTHRTNWTRSVLAFMAWWAASLARTSPSLRSRVVKMRPGVKTPAPEPDFGGLKRGKPGVGLLWLSKKKNRRKKRKQNMEQTKSELKKKVSL